MATGVTTGVTRSIVTRTEYDSFGNLVTRIEDATSSAPRITRYAYDALGNQIRTIFPDAGVLNEDGVLVATGTMPFVEVTYDALGRAIIQRDVRGHYSQKLYDSQDRLIYEIDQEGYVTAYTYNAFGEQYELRRLSVPVQIANDVPISRDGLESLIVLGNEDRRIVTSYDKAGRVASVTQVLWDAEAGDGGSVDVWGEQVSISTTRSETWWLNANWRRTCGKGGLTQVRSLSRFGTYPRLPISSGTKQFTTTTLRGVE